MKDGCIAEQYVELQIKGIPHLLIHFCCEKIHRPMNLRQQNHELDKPSGANIYIYIYIYIYIHKWFLYLISCCFQGDSTELGGTGSCCVFKFGHDSNEYECGRQFFCHIYAMLPFLSTKELGLSHLSPPLHL